MNIKQADKNSFGLMEPSCIQGNVKALH